ncbi:MAG TPA: DUF1109 domain-containing protein [Magnetospirillaceae bacterium]|nr:DUF1109 domain-containing protein [Magnetospirillaceae bacterium]
MMRTEQLIDSLAEKLQPVPPRAVERRIALALAAGMAVSALLTAAGLGIRPDLLAALHGPIFWMKAGYVGSLAALAAIASTHLARPDMAPPRWLWLFALPVLVLAVMAATELARAPLPAWPAIWLGKSAMICPFLVLGLAVPIFFALLRALGKLAPTRLRAAGALAGVTAGAAAALVYCLHCPESTASFVVTWYSGGIALAGLIGALLGPRLLRW